MKSCVSAMTAIAGLLLLLAALFAPWSSVEGDSDTAKQELVDDIGSALLLASCDRTPKAICNASDAQPLLAGRTSPSIENYSTTVA